ncbi:hypothetical protein B5M42_017245 [Paenibacillus athensensis]|uniref:GS catalytic domain-containing protein n=1 Tax=Paenibacillus athensensis TaxID=1967502 RepID=A0A4Y8PSA4_9BACL|nr:hypothetical protein [Paenibacillus athensensis]MCD1260550.1 hypothetical protein [Paenibacillus athensensis]
MSETTLFGIVDCVGRLKVKAMNSQFLNVHTAVGFCNYLYVTDYSMTTWPNLPDFNWESGFGDVFLHQRAADSLLKEFVVESTKLLLGSPLHPDGEPVAVCPRRVLHQALRRLDDQHLHIKIGIEMEFYLFKETEGRLDPIVDYDTDYDFVSTFGHLNQWSELKELLEASPISCEGLKCEAGKGQMEITLAYTDALTVADQVLVAKQIIKTFFAGRGLLASFMAKPSIDDASSGFHLHVSLHAGQDGQPVPCTSPQAQNFIAGILSRLSDWMCFYAPNHNSYKRLRSNSWVPVDHSIGMDNRTSTIRIIHDAKGHFEFRLPGSDTNIYLTIAALIYSGISGLQNNAARQAFEAVRGLPSFSEAVDFFRSSGEVLEQLGTTAHAHYSQFFKNELLSFNNYISDVELRRYLKHA